MKKNVFVFGLNDFNRAKLESLGHADQYRFHGLIELEKLKDAASYDFHALRSEAQKRLDAFDEPIDALINFWDFPASVMHPILCREYKLPGPSLEAVIKCGNKALSRLEQQRVVPATIPRFSIFDPFDDDPLKKIELDNPFWIKPILSYSGYLGFRIENEADFHQHLATLRGNIDRYAKPYAELMDYVALDPALRV